MTEHDAFAKLIASLEEATNAARIIGVHRSDRRWDKVAEGIAMSKNLVFQLAMKGTK